MDPSLPSGSKDAPVALTGDDDDFAVDNDGKDEATSSVIGHSDADHQTWPQGRRQETAREQGPSDSSRLSRTCMP